MNDAKLRPVQKVAGCLIFLGSFYFAIKVGRWVSDQVILSAYYGLNRLAAENLKVIEPGPLRLGISNGDVLGQGYARAAGVIWGVTAAIIWMISFTLLHFGLRPLLPGLIPPTESTKTAEMGKIIYIPRKPIANDPVLRRSPSPFPSPGGRGDGVS